MTSTVVVKESVARELRKDVMHCEHLFITLHFDTTFQNFENSKTYLKHKSIDDVKRLL